MLIKYRIYLTLLLLSLLPLVLVSVLTENMLGGALKQTIVYDFKNLVHEKADSIGRHLDERINETRLLATHPYIIAAVQEANGQYQGQDEHRVMDEIHRLDQAWIENKGATEKAERLMSNDTSHLLTTIQARNPESYGEIFLTDRLGANVASTKLLSDYYQADEYWWQAGSRHVQKGAFLDDRGFDTSVGAIVIGVVVPVIDGGEVIGILKINFRVRSIINIIASSTLNSGYELLLVRSDGSVISSSDVSHPKMLTETEIQMIRTKEMGQWEKTRHGKNLFAAYHPMKHTFSTRQTMGAVQGITGETTQVKKWYVIYEVDKEIAFASLNKLHEMAITLAIMAFSLAALSGFLLSRAITRPLTTLKNGTEIIGGGNLTHRITLNARDEFSTLARSFNSMTQRLQESLISRDENALQLRKITDSTNDAIIMADNDGSIVFWNRAAEKIFGFPQAEAIGHSLTELIIPEKLREMHSKGIKAFGHTGKGAVVGTTVELPGLHKEGHELLVELSLSSLQLKGKWHAVGVLRDITERKKMEKALLESEQQFRTLVTNTEEIVYMIDQDGTFLLSEGKGLAALGLEPGEVVGQSAFELYKDYPNMLNNIRRSLNGETVSAEVNVGGNYFSNRYTPHKNSEGETVGLLGLSVNITQQKHAEEAILDSKQRLKELMASVPVGISVSDQEGQITEANNIAFEMFGYDSKESFMSDAAANRYSDPQDREHFIKLLKKGPVRNFELQLKRRDGSPFWCSVSSVMHNAQNGEVQFINAFMDTTERRQMEDELHRLAQVVEQSPESIVITNLDAEIEYVNDAFVDITGYSREEVIGNNPSILHSGKTPPETYTAMWNRLNQGHPWKGELYNRKKDGTEFIEFSQVTPIRQPDGTTSHYVAVKEDITEKKQLAQELDEHRNNLEEMVITRTSQLTKAQEQAEAANKAKSVFLANMSHEIRTPMNAIIGLTHLMQRAGPTPAQAERLIKIDTAAIHLLSIINDILDISKIESGRLVLEQTDFHLDAIFDNVQSLLKEQANSKGVIIEANLDDVPHWLRGDPTRLRQALLNYVSNAVKFTEKGTIYLRAKKLEQRDDEILVQFEVQDSGIGIKPDRLSRLFKAFEQADTSTTREYGGTGLGLVITSRLAQLMGGSVGAESEPGQGSTFWFTVWLGRGHGVMPDRAVTEVVDTPMVLRNQYAGSRILLVEDNAINQEVAVELLCSVGMAVDTANNGREAVEKVRTNNYDLVLMDIQMPEMDGLEATYLIRKTNDKEELPILAMSANVFEEYRQASLVAGMNDFVAKPVDPKNLYSTIIKWLPKREVTGSESNNAGLSNPNLPASNNLTPTPYEAALHTQLMAIEDIDAKTGLRNMRGDVTGYLRLLHQFDSAHIEDMHKLTGHLTDGENEDARRIAHTIKGVAGALGLLRLQEAAKALEMYLRNPNGGDNGDDDERTHLMEVVSTEQKSFHESLTHIGSKSEPVSTVKADPLEAQAVLDRLAPLLTINDAAVNDLFLESEELLKQSFGPAAEQLGQQIESFDYPAALITLESISDSLAPTENPQPTEET